MIECRLCVQKVLLNVILGFHHICLSKSRQPRLPLSDDLKSEYQIRVKIAWNQPSNQSGGGGERAAELSERVHARMQSAEDGRVGGGNENSVVSFHFKETVTVKWKKGKTLAAKTNNCKAAN